MYQYILVHTGMYWYVLVYTTHIYNVILVPTVCGVWHCVQDTIVVISPYPYSIAEEIDDVPFEDCWYARPQLLFQCHLRPTGLQRV